MSAIRVSLFLICLWAGISATACSSHPGWVFRLPSGAAAASSPPGHADGLLGTWVRLVESRYSVVNPHVYWKGREWIEIRPGTGSSEPAYEKHHLYAEYYRGELRRRAYRESGIVRLGNNWLLFQPASALVWNETRRVDEAEQKAFVSSRRILLPDLNSPAGRAHAKSLAPRALRFFYNVETRGTREQGTLRRLKYITPLAYERFGRVFEHGIYEGCTEPCDPRSKIFLSVVRRYNVNSFHRHGYLKKEVSPGPVF